MFANLVRSLSLLAVVAALASPGSTRVLFAADKDSPADAKLEGKTRAGKPKRDAMKGRLPAHYADLVDGEQRTKIYAIQAEHEAAINELQASLKAAIAKRDAAVAAVLTPAQQEKLAKLQAEDKEKKGKRGESPDSKKKEGAGDSAKSAEAPDAKPDKTK